MMRNKVLILNKKGEKQIKKISRVARRVSIEGTIEYNNFIEKHKKSLKKLADQ